MKSYLEFFVVSTFTLVILGTLFSNIVWIGSFIYLIGIFIIPGWLLTRILFANSYESEPELHIILTVSSGAVLVALEMFVLNLLSIKINRESAILVGLLVSWLLMGTIYLYRLVSSPKSINIKSGVISLLTIGIVIVVLSGLILLHQPISQEYYTEFYAIPHLEPAGSRIEIFVVSHEQQTHTFIITCKDEANTESLLSIMTVEPTASENLQLNLSTNNDLAKKIRFNLYLENVETPYRWLDLTSPNCNHLLAK